MHYKKFPPSDELSPFVECYFEWEGEAPDRTEVQSPPNCRGAIVFNYGDPTRAYQQSAPETDVPDAFICGLFTSNFHRVLNGKIGMFGIVFRACGIHNLFGLRMTTLVNSRMPLDLLPGDQGAPMLQRVRAAMNGEDRSKLCNEFLAALLPEARKRMTIIDEVVDFIDKKNGVISIDESAAAFKVSKRYIEKQFLVKVGVSPKFYTRLRRFQAVALKVAYNPTMDWHDAVVESGYHDQSHLSKEFMEFNGQSPSEYHQKHKEMSRFVK